MLTELWNGTSWTSNPNIATARNSAAGGGTQTALAFGGLTPGPGTATEEFTGPGSQL
jgi:hypothetical protein